MAELHDADLERQIKVSRMLAMGFVFSVMPIAGAGSLVALILGLKARKIIRQSKNELSGIGLAWWCIIAGLLGLLILPPLSILTVLRYIK
jgi:hypothetical protein